MRIFDADVTGSLHVSGSSNFKGGVTVSGSQTITGSLTVHGNAKLGDQITDVHTVTGSLNVTGSISGSLSGVLRTDYVDFNTGSTIIGEVGRMTWNDQDGTIDLGLKGGNVTLQVGQEQLVRVVNGTGNVLLETDYQVVRVDGAQGNRLNINLAQADNDDNSAETLGLVTENIGSGEEGFVTVGGLVRKINTTGALQGELWNDGDILYLSPFIAGQITNVKPEAPNHMVIVGYVVRAHANQGAIFVKVNNGYEIDELHNVRINTGSLSYGDLLMRSGSIWTNSKNLSGSYQLTGSLDISGSQTINGNQIISGSITITQNISVLGTSSFVYVTSSNLNLTGPFIYTNIFEPIERFGGLVVFDSGSESHLATASLLWDSLNNHWIYQNASGSMYSGGMLLSGPRNTGSLGDEIGLINTRIPKSVGGDHLDNSNIYDTGTVVKIISNSEITGSLKVTGGISGSIDYSYIQNVPSLVSGSAQINITGTTGYSAVSSSIASALNGSWRASDGINSDSISFDETVTIQGGANTNVTFLPGVNTFTINTSHQSVNATTSSNNSGRTYIQDILVDSFGHITGITTATETVVNTDIYTTGATFNTSDGVVTFTRNDGNTYTVDLDGRYGTSSTDYYVTGGTFNTGTGNLRLTRNDGGTINIDLEGRYLTAHPSVSAASSSNNSGRTYIQDILLDSFGHITGITTSTETVVDTYTTGGTINNTTGLITFTKSDGGTYTTNISGYVTTQIANLVDSAPTTLDTLNELAAALGDDPNFATTIANSIGSKVSKSGDTMTGNLTAPKFITSGGTSSQFVKGDGSLDSSTYLTSYSETDTLATVTARGSSTATPVTFNSNVTLGNSADLVFSDLAGTFPTSGKGFDWTLNNDGARIYAIQPSSDSIDFVFQLRDNATTNDRFVFWVDDYQGPAFDKYPLIIRGGTEFDLVNSALYIGGTLVLSNGRVLQNVSGNISMFTNDSNYLTAHPSVTAASSSNNSGRTYIQDILLDSFGHITGITTATETVVDTNDFINNVLLLGNTLRFTGTGGAFSGDIDLTPFTVDNNTFVTGGTFNTGTGNLRLTRNDGNTVDVSLEGRYLTAHPSVSAASSSNNSGRTYIQDILLDSFGHITGITTATETVTDTFTTGATFNTSDGVITFTNNNGGGTFTVDIDGRFLTSYSETDTLATVTARGNTTNQSITVSGLTSNNDVVISGGTLTVYESVSGATVFAVDGTNGRLFAVTDDLSNSLFSVNTISGLPVIEAFADYHIVMGRFNQNDFYLGTTGEIGMGTAPVSGYKLAVVGNVRATSFVKSGGTSSQFLKADGSVDSNTYLTSYNNYYTTGATFNTSNGIITFNRNDGNTYTVDIDGKYAESSHTHSIDSITDEHRLFNNMGDNHSTQTDFNAITNFGARFVQGTNNGPGTGSSQFYGFTLGLGDEYGIDAYALQLALPRYGSSDKYISIRTKEASSWGSWYKIHAGYADTAGDADTLDGQHGSYYYPASNPSNYISSYVNTYTTGGTFNTGNGNLTFTRNDGGTYTVNLDGRYQASGSYLTAESDTLATVTARGASTTTAVSFNGGLTTTGFTNVSSAVLANSTGISPNSYSNRVVAGGIGDGSWGVTTGIGGNAGTNHNWSMGHNGSNFYFGISNGSSTTLSTWMQVSPSRVITLNGYTTNGFLKTSSSDGTLTVDTTTYYPSSNPSNYATTGYVQTQIANLVDSAPSTLDTLNELAAALGDDPNFVTTVTNSIGNKVSKSGDTMTGNLTFGATSNLGINWAVNTDGAFIRFVSSGNQAGGSYLEIGTTDDSDEEIKFTQSGNLRFYMATDGFLKNGSGYKYVFENGTWGINISGNAATVTDGVYTTGTYSNPAWITSLAGSKITGNISGNSANITAYTINQNLGTTDSPTFSVVKASRFEASQSSTRNKLSLWGTSDQYVIGMESAVVYGGLNDYAMTFQFNNDADRGFWWGHADHNTSQGAMALTTNGYLTVARGVRVGYGESDTTTPNVPLQVYGSGSLVFDVQGSLGQLFSVTDSLSGSLYSVNDISGLPILEVFSDDRVVMGSYGLNSFVVSGTTTTVSGSLAVSGSATVNGGTVWHSNNDGASSGLDADLLDGQHGSYYAAASSLSNYLPLAGGTMTGTISFSNDIGTALQGTVGTNDFWRIYGSSTSSNAGYLEISTSDDGTEPIYFRQYTGVFTTLVRTATILDGSGNTSFPGSVTGNSFVKSGGSSSQFLMADGSVSTNPGWLTAHPAVSAASSSDNSGRTYIQDILLDSFGHITGITTATETVVNTDTNYYVTSASFNTSNGIITLTRNDGGTVTVDIDGRYKSVNGQTEVDVTAPAASSGSWNSATADEWGNPKFDTTYNKYTYGDAPAWLEFNIPSGMKSAWLSQLTWSSGGYVDIHGVQSGGELVFLRRINTRQTVENTDEGINHDGSTVTFVASGLDDYTKIRLTVQSGRFHLTGLAFSDSDNEGTEGVGMVHPAQISHQGSGSGLDADLLDGNHASAFYLATNPSGYITSSGSISGNAATATLASTVTINYNNDSNSTYQMLWGSGNSVYGTAGVYLNPASDYVYAVSFNASDWFRSSGASGWYNSTYGGGIYQTESTMVRTYDGRGFWIDGGNSNTVQDATLYVTATNNNDWLAQFNAYNGSKTEYGVYVNIAAGATYGYALRTDSSSFTYRVDGSGRVYAPIYYDINDTAYYLNPASTSNLATVKLNSTASGTEVFTVDGVNGRLFTITDDLSDSLFSVNTIAGVPVIEAFSDYRVIMGRYNQYDLHINSSGQVAMGTSTATANYKLTVNGSIVVTPTGAWNAATPALNVGGTGDGRLQVRHIYGKSSASAAADHLWLQYQNTGNHVQIGDSGGGNHLYVSGNIYMGGYFGGNLVATQSWVGSQGYLTSETDTLSTVVARGSSTSSAITVGGLTVSKSGTNSTITFPAQTNDPGFITHYESNNAARMYFSVSDDDNSTDDYFQFGAGGTYRTTIYTNGRMDLTDVYLTGGGWFRNYGNVGLYNQDYGNHWYATSNATWNAAGNNTSYVEIAMRTGGHQGTVRGFFYADSSSNIGILNSAGNWGIRLDNSRNTVLYGNLTVGQGTSSDIYMTDTDETTRRIHCNSSRIGFLNSSSNWGSYSSNDGSWSSDQGMYAPIYYDLSNTNYYLNANGYSNLGTVRFNSSGSGAEVIVADGVNGRLFTITDDMTDSIFSVNTISGLPVIEAFADYKVVMGRYAQNDFIINPSGQVSIGAAAQGSYKFTVIGGQWGSYFRGGDTGTGSDIARFVDANSNTKLLVRGDGNLYVYGTGYINDNVIWNAGNDGASSGLDADLLDGQHGSYYAAASSLSSYLPLAGGTMTGTITITHTDIRSDATSNWTGDPGSQGKIQYHSNRWYIVSDSSSNRIVQFRRNGTDVSYIDNDGVFQGQATNVTINYNNDSNSTYQLLWGSGTSVYGTAGVYVNPSLDYVYATAFVSSKFGLQDGTPLDCYMEITDENPTEDGINYGAQFFFYGDQSTNSSHLYFGGALIYNNLVVNGRITENSSIRYKKDIQQIENGLEKVLQLSGVTYTKINNEQKEAGVIAEEVAKILPEAVGFDTEGRPDSVSYGRLTALLIEAIKDLKKEIDELKGNK